MQTTSHRNETQGMQLNKTLKVHITSHPRQAPPDPAALPLTTPSSFPPFIPLLLPSHHTRLAPYFPPSSPGLIPVLCPPSVAHPGRSNTLPMLPPRSPLPLHLLNTPTQPSWPLCSPSPQQCIRMTPRPLSQIHTPLPHPSFSSMQQGGRATHTGSLSEAAGQVMTSTPADLSRERNTLSVTRHN